MQYKHKKFIENYEKYVKDDRDTYYKSLMKNQKMTSGLTLVPSFYLVSFIGSLLIILIGRFSLKAYVVGIIIMIGLNYLINFLIKKLKLNGDNKYLQEIRRLGYLTIDDYEKKLKKYVTGPGGYYEYLLNNLKKEYNINDNVRRITSINGEEYYIWTNQKQDKVNLLNSKINIRPEIISIKMASIRYYRVDNTRKMIIVKTDVTEYCFTLEALSVIQEIMKSKRLEDLITFTPGDYINDFELYMHNIQSRLDDKVRQERSKINSGLSKAITYILILGVIIAVKIFLDKEGLLLEIGALLDLFMMNRAINEIFSAEIVKVKTDKEFIKFFNSDPECREKFQELKFSLGISEKYDKVYTTEGGSYLTWVANGYFHVFLDVIYFNVVYMAINTSDVLYYKVEGRECLVKLKNRTLAFTKDAARVFAKILPNKDYEWLKGYQNK